ncbi:sulfatase-like hydrolase/transferase [Bradyrhizobium lablabi]|uniref:sulfatase-like hydrolase/transferase n=1 Tax=Bradyrhizobium lablabi TaxID=722472 RepID=UPI001BA4ED4C|nr:sulfatase-like hydrolase/transferase [Bradyrhizobium lablabi]MBR1125375.1 sulfatase-like hydrolase/transferase [Bradyrhizobium lablabi]
MAPAPKSRPSSTAAVSGVAAIGIGCVAALHLGALYALFTTEYGPFAITLALLAWLFANCLVLVFLPRPGIAAALSLILTVTLIAFSRFKFDILQLSVTFLDFLIIDRDTFSFLLSVFPRLKMPLLIAAVAAVPALWVIWRTDPFRISRKISFALLVFATAAISLMAIAKPEQPWEPFQGVNHISSLARSGVVAVSHLTSTGWIEADPPAQPSLPLARGAHAATSTLAPPTDCDTTVKRPHVIMLLDESSFDVRTAPGIKVPADYAGFFKSFDGKQRTFVAEATGGPTWYTEFSVVTGLSARSFGDLKFYVTRIAAGRVTRGLPAALQHCGYKTVSLYPTYGDFLSARTFQKATGVEDFIDMAAMGVNEDMQPDSFYYDQALKVFEREAPSRAPVFMFLYLTANHFPWTDVYRPELTPDWKAPGNTADIDEYIRRQSMTAQDYGKFVARLKQDYPDEQFLIVRFGDHQPAISQKMIEPGIDRATLAKRLMTSDPRYFSTYYAIDTVNFTPRDLSSALDKLDASYLPIVIQDAAGVPLDPTFAEQKKIMLRCSGVFYTCNKGAEARRFNRLLIDAGLIKGL